MSSDIAISVRNVSKKYFLGQTLSHDTLRDQITHKAKETWHWLRRHDTKPAKSPSTNEFWALRDISFDVHQGEVVGIIGRNGAGKSTLLKILSQITEPTTGEIHIHGRISSLLEVGTGFHPELSGRENIFLNGAILGMRQAEIKAKFDEIVAFSEIEKFLDTPVKRYSSGMYVRLGFAVAAHLETEILVVDEVLSVGDMSFQKKCMGKMEDIGKSGRTIFFVSHNMAAISTLCQKAMLLENGRMVRTGTTHECIEAYTEQCGGRRGTLLDHIKSSNTILRVEALHVNGSYRDFLHVSDLIRPLEIETEITVTASCRVALHAFLRDHQGQALGIYSPGHVNGSVFALKPGHYKLRGTLMLPKLTQGRYFLDIGISNPGITVYANFPNGLILDVEGYACKTGMVFPQNTINGYLVLDGFSELL